MLLQRHPSKIDLCPNLHQGEAFITRSLAVFTATTREYINMFNKSILIYSCKHTDLGIASICVNVTKQTINSCCFKLMMTAAEYKVVVRRCKSRHILKKIKSNQTSRMRTKSKQELTKEKKHKPVTSQSSMVALDV